MAAFATLSARTNGSEKYYTIRFNTVASRAMDGVEWMEVSKTKDGKYIIFTPSTEPLENMRRSMVRIERTSGCARIFCSWIVKHEQFFRADWFDSRRRKVKKDKKGNIYICLKEVISNDGRNRERSAV